MNIYDQHMNNIGFDSTAWDSSQDAFDRFFGELNKQALTCILAWHHLPPDIRAEHVLSNSWAYKEYQYWCAHWNNCTK